MPYNKIKKAASYLAQRADAWYSGVTGLGVLGVDPMQSFQLAARGILSPAQLEVLYHDHDLAATIVDAPVDHAIMLGWSVPADVDGDLRRASARWGVRDLITRAATWGRLYGGGAILLGIDRGLMEDPISIDQVQPGDLIYVLDLELQHITPHTYYDDPGEPKYGKPRTYSISRDAEMTGREIHESRLLIFDGARTTHNYRQINHGFGLSVLQRVYSTIMKTDTSFEAFYRFLQDLSQAVFKLDGLVNMIAEGEAQTVQDRMNAVNLARSAMRAIMLDADRESFEQIGAANITGVGQAMDVVMQRLAAAARMPVAILMGMSPAGLNATGESDMRSWFNTVQVTRTQYIEPNLQRLLQVIARSEAIALDVEIEWPSLWQMAPNEEADVRLKQAQTTEIWIRSGVVLPEEATQGHFGSGRYDPDISQAVGTIDDPTPED